MNNQRGVIHLAAPLLLLFVAAAIIVGIIATGIIKIPGVKKQEPTVSLQKQYQNPFDKDTQYVNPFSQYQNPFDNLR